MALATPRRRIALTGNLDFVQNSFEDIKLVLLNPDGCMLVEQQIGGSSQHSGISPPNIFYTLLGPVVNLLERGQQFLTGRDCEVVYTGTVAAPP
ncbi:MAG: hypothetical protein WDZ52_04495 [Pseudohongiellaceae bacterium]